MSVLLKGFIFIQFSKWGLKPTLLNDPHEVSGG